MNKTCINCGFSRHFHKYNVTGNTCKEFKAPENAGCGKWLDDFRNMSCVKGNLCPDCKNAGDNHSHVDKRICHDDKPEENGNRSSGTNAKNHTGINPLAHKPSSTNASDNTHTSPETLGLKGIGENLSEKGSVNSGDTEPSCHSSDNTGCAKL